MGYILNLLKIYIFSHFFNQMQQNAMKRNMYGCLTLNQRAAGSNPSSPTNRKNARQDVFFIGANFSSITCSICILTQL